MIEILAKALFIAALIAGIGLLLSSCAPAKFIADCIQRTIGCS